MADCFIEPCQALGRPSKARRDLMAHIEMDEKLEGVSLDRAGTPKPDKAELVNQGETQRCC